MRPPIALLSVPERRDHSVVLLVTRAARPDVRMTYPNRRVHAVAKWVSAHMIGLGIDCIGVADTERGLQVAEVLVTLRLKINTLAPPQAAQS